MTDPALHADREAAIAADLYDRLTDAFPHAPHDALTDLAAACAEVAAAAVRRVEHKRRRDGRDTLTKGNPP